MKTCGVNWGVSVRLYENLGVFEAPLGCFWGIFGASLRHLEGVFVRVYENFGRLEAS